MKTITTVSLHSGGPKPTTICSISNQPVSSKYIKPLNPSNLKGAMKHSPVHHLGSGLQCFCIYFHPLQHIFIFIFKLPPVLENILRKRSSRSEAILLPAWRELKCWLMNHCKQVSPGQQRHCSYPNWTYMEKESHQHLKKTQKLK